VVGQRRSRGQVLPLIRASLPRTAPSCCAQQYSYYGDDGFLAATPYSIPIHVRALFLSNNPGYSPGSFSNAIKF
jgi:hypothetical protein